MSVVTEEEYQDALLFLSTQNAPTHNDRAERHDIEQIDQTIVELTALLNTIKTYGVTKSVLSFADHDKTLSSTIKIIPSLESLTIDIAPENAGEIVAALEAALGEQIKLRINKFVDRVKRFGAAIIGRRSHESQEWSHFQVLMKMLSSNERTWDQSKATRKQFLLWKLTDIEKWHRTVMNGYALCKELATTEFPAKEDDFKLWIKAFGAKFNQVSLVASFEFSANGQPKLINWDENMQSQYRPTKMTPVAGGYSGIESFKTLMDIYKEYTKGDDELVKSLDAVEELFIETSDDSGVYVKSVQWAYTMMYHLMTQGDAFQGHMVPMVMKMMFSCTKRSTGTPAET